jgi:hypothetical protein
MKYYVIENGKKKYIKAVARDRQELAKQIGKKFKVGDSVYHVTQVKAETSNDNTAVSLILGGAIGLLGGIPGAVAGSAIGGLLGRNKDQQEMQFVDAFNKSKVK